ncbi:MAG: stage 0 sporulation family protein [Planctomyces sp.]
MSESSTRDSEVSRPESSRTDSPRCVVRYGNTRLLGDFEARRDQRFQRGDEVIVRSERGVEWGVVLCPADARTATFMGGGRSGGGRILRPVTDDDRRAREEHAIRERELFRRSAELMRERTLQMQLIDVELIFGGEKLVLYYLSESRIDFRELVRLLARDFNLRIEMRQIGIRDEARLLADYGDCGKPVCCNTHLREMPAVSMKMAKLQKASLDPSKISGRCGRLKGCLRYEYDTYEEHRRELPPIGATVLTRSGQGRVLSQELLARKLVVVFDDGRRQIADESDIVTVISRGSRRNENGEDD